ncbi:preprotein translocase subunit TatB [Polymorphospora sp. NPDC051019]|uniref:preprotein translocase subunit TatB n=1 Tax=Polymorphospora sp. NPDC051019 TaxID=3155725 RepID=UPI003444E119
MFENLNWWEIGALLLLALLIFGDRLPNVINDGLRMLRNLRQMATNATGDLSRELGTDIQLEDLHPKAFIRKHVLSEEDEALLRKPLQSAYENVRSDLTGVHDELKDVASAADLRKSATSLQKPRLTKSATRTAEANGTATAPAPATRSFDVDAT